MRIYHRLLLLVLVTSLTLTVSASEFLESLQPEQQIEGFTVKNVYENSAGKLMGARFVSDKYGFVMDLMQIQSVPQGFMWVKSAPGSDRGEPHACEHLLLGKGGEGRYVATLEDMSLGLSTAYTSQIYTAYPFNTTAGADAFYELFEAKLNAMANPTFTDEEIRREVCNVGVVEDQETGLLSLEEKGTVYTEMVSSTEKYYYPMWGNMGIMQYGPDHPAANSSGGLPDSMRSMTAENMREFQESAYRMGNMGIVTSIPDNMPLRECLAKTDSILNKVQAEGDPDSPGKIADLNLPPPIFTKPFGQIVIDSFPHDNPEEPGHILMGYPPQLDLDNFSRFMLDLFLETFGGGPGTNLYDLFINSETQKMNLGGNAAWGYHSDDPGHPVFFGLSSVSNGNVEVSKMDSARAYILAEIEKVATMADNSEELKKFNERAKARLIETFKQGDKFLNSPPGFGFRSNPGAAWYSIVSFLEKEPGFRKSLVFADHMEKANNLLAGEKNFWTDLIKQWKLLETLPYISGVKPSAELIASSQKAKENRLAGYLEEFKQKYGTDDDQEAIRKYREEFDQNTAELEALAAKDELPGFVDNPPLSIDESLKFEQFTIQDKVSMVASSFENLTTGTVGMAMRLDVLPSEYLVYVPFLTSAMGSIGVIKDGEVIEYDQMDDRLRREVLELTSYFSTNMATERIELVVRGAGSNDEELQVALDWMETALYSSYLDVANLPRIRDVIDQELVSLRNSMNGSEENWVQGPSNAYRYQTNPLYLMTSSFLTQIHAYQRLKWQFRKAETLTDQEALLTFLDQLAETIATMDRSQLEEFFASATAAEAEAIDLAAYLKDSAYSESVHKLAGEIIEDLKLTLPSIPNANLPGDLVWLCGQIKEDLLVDPSTALTNIKTIFELITRADNARMFMISSTDTREATLFRLGEFVARLDNTGTSVRQDYGEAKHILERARSRQPQLETPVYAGLVYEGTRNGVLLFNARFANQYDTSEDAILDILAGKLYSGGGGHGLFMRTWGAGLAYSNGYGIGDRSGRVNYYAERCPDVAATMRFVVSVLEEAQEDQRLVEYAIAQMFSGSRAASRYEGRGEAMAADLTDGYLPETVEKYRRAVLAMRSRENLSEELRSRMQKVYGQTLIGYGPPLASSDDGYFFLIGPETQFESLTKLVESAEGKQEITRLYPRDFWLTD